MRRAISRNGIVGRAIARELGRKRITRAIRAGIEGDLIAVVRRGIIERRGSKLAICCRTIDDYDSEFLRAMVLKAQGRTWHERDEAIHRAASYLGFGRVGPLIRRRLDAAIRTLVRRGALESNGHRE